jgi:hypothetical protein
LGLLTIDIMVGLTPSCLLVLVVLRGMRVLRKTKMIAWSDRKFPYLLQ